MPTVTIPHNFHTPPKYVREYLASNKRFAILVWHRRARKSRAALNKQVSKIVQQKTPAIFYYALPNFRQAKRVMWDSLVNEHIPPELISKKNESELSITYKNGCIQRFIGTEDPDSHRGTNPIDVVFDEYSEMKEEVWTAIFQPVLRENKGTATFVFTPKGRNHSYKLLEMAKENEQWFWSVKNVHDTGVFSEEELEEVRRQTPQALFDQEYLCEFLQDASSFFRRVRENIYTPTDELLKNNYSLGVDLAKYQDWTVLTPFDLNTFKVLPQDRFNQVDWNLQKSRIEATARRHRDADITIDATGVGDPIVEDLQRTGLTINPFKFTATSRTELLNHLSMLIEQDKIQLPNDEGLLTELETMRYELSDKGKISIQVPEGLHDDRIMSLALAVWGHHTPYTPIIDDDFVEEEPLYSDIGI